MIGGHISRNTYVTYPLTYSESPYYTTGLDVNEEKHHVINSTLIQDSTRERHATADAISHHI